MARGYLGLGSNVGDCREHLSAAVAELARHQITPRCSSSLYETEPVGLVLDQPRFLNACLEVETPLEPHAVLDACKAVERGLGRQSGGPRHGPRVIDIDVLLLGECTVDSARLTLPHPELTARRFVLVPLLELEPELTLPDGTPLAAALMALGPGQDVRRVGEPLLPGAGG